MPLAGHIDVFCSSGYVEGWAYDQEAPHTQLVVSVRNQDDHEVARGYANRYREDLAKAGFGMGWCSYRLRIAGSVGRLRNAPARLVRCDTEEEICPLERVPFLEDSDRRLTDLSEIANLDPAAMTSIDHLSACQDMFEAYARRSGVDAFVRTTYCYVLSRPADVGGRATYGRLLRGGKMTYFELIALLADSDEFRSRPRQLASPKSASFPFV